MLSYHDSNNMQMNRLGWTLHPLLLVNKTSDEWIILFFPPQKRPRFSNHQQESDRHSELGINGELNIDRMPVTLAIDCSNVIERGYNIGADSLLQNNLEWNGEVEETFGMDVECETKVNDMECTHVSKLHTDSKTVTQTSPFSKAENVEDEGSPAREFLLK